MPKIVLAFILAALVTAIACGGGELHPDDYAEECGELANELNATFNMDVYYVEGLSERFEELEYALDDFKALRNYLKRQMN